MGKRLNIPQAAEVSGLSEYALRIGIKQGRFPHIRVGTGKGKILIDIDLLERYLEQEALDNASAEDRTAASHIINYGQLRQVHA